MTTTLLSTSYFGPVQWYQKLHRAQRVVIEQHENFQKQTFRNRCLIATANGTQTLTVPVEREKGAVSSASSGADACGDIRDIRISEHGNWRHLHWNALCSAYGESPFFEFYADDVRPFFEKKWKYLFDFNMEITHTMCQLLDVRPVIHLSDTYYDGSDSDVLDYREAIRPKHPAPDADFIPKPYYQVYSHKHGFIANLSVLDLLFNMGNESILILNSDSQTGEIKTLETQ